MENVDQHIEISKSVLERLAEDGVVVANDSETGRTVMLEVNDNNNES